VICILAMKMFILILLLSLTIFQKTNAATACSSLFGGIHGIAPQQYTIYDPANIDQQIDELLEKGELKKLQSANPRKTNLSYFNDFVLDAVDRLVRFKIRKMNPAMDETINELGTEAFSRIASETLTYEWLMEFSYRVRAVFSNKKSPNLVNLEKRIKAFPHDIMIPTFARQDFVHFIEIEGHQFTFTAMREEDEYVDGIANPLTPEQNDNHDFQHYYLTQKNDNLVLDPKSKFSPLWRNLHQKIADRIGALPENERRYVEFIYFYFLHEEFETRSRLLVAYLDPTRKMSDYAGSLLTFETIKNHFNGSAHPVNVQRSEIYRRTTRHGDFRDAFPEKTNPQEILLVGIGGFLDILKQIESEPRH
jgi:hypothetical protein